jgi:hypothetical protein
MTRRQRWVHLVAWLVLVPITLAVLTLALRVRPSSSAIELAPTAGAQP